MLRPLDIKLKLSQFYGSRLKWQFENLKCPKIKFFFCEGVNPSKELLAEFSIKNS